MKLLTLDTGGPGHPVERHGPGGVAGLVGSPYDSLGTVEFAQGGTTTVVAVKSLTG